MGFKNWSAVPKGVVVRNGSSFYIKLEDGLTAFTCGYGMDLHAAMTAGWILLGDSTTPEGSFERA